MWVRVVRPGGATAARTLSDRARWEKDIQPLVEAAAWMLEIAVALNPETARKLARDVRVRRQADYSRYRVSIPGRVDAEHRGEWAKVNGGRRGKCPKSLMFCTNRT